MSAAWIVLFVLLLLLVLASLVLSIYIFAFFRKLSRGIGKEELMKILDNLSNIEKNNTDSIKEIRADIEKMKKDNLSHFQKMALVRFNPFSEMGGEHSFSLALLDQYLSGFLITGLHTRERTRVYIKRVEKGKSRQDLSREEREALSKASI